jgi:hypothetical protein
MLYHNLGIFWSKSPPKTINESEVLGEHEGTLYESRYLNLTGLKDHKEVWRSPMKVYDYCQTEASDKVM